MSAAKAESNNAKIISKRLIFRYLPIPYYETKVPKGTISETEVIRKTKLIAFSISKSKCKFEDIEGKATITIFAMNCTLNKSKQPIIVTHLSSTILFIINYIEFHPY